MLLTPRDTAKVLVQDAKSRPIGLLSTPRQISNESEITATQNPHQRKSTYNLDWRFVSGLVCRRFFADPVFRRIFAEHLLVSAIYLEDIESRGERNIACKFFSSVFFFFDSECSFKKK